MRPRGLWVEVLGLEVLGLRVWGLGLRANKSLWLDFFAFYSRASGEVWVWLCLVWRLTVQGRFRVSGSKVGVCVCVFGFGLQVIRV